MKIYADSFIDFLSSDGVFVVKFWATKKDKSFPFLCSDGKNVSASLLEVNYTFINDSCSKPKEPVQNDVEYGIIDSNYSFKKCSRTKFCKGCFYFA